MEIERTFVGLDVHARSLVACALDGRTGELSKARLVPENETVLAWLQQLAGPVAVVYEAGPTGYGLARFLTGRGVRCVIAAPSKLHRPSGDRVKTDAKDALLLARLLRLGWPTVSRLQCLRGVSTLTAFGLAVEVEVEVEVEVGDWTRFTGSTIGTYVGRPDRELQRASSGRCAAGRCQGACCRPRRPPAAWRG